MSTEKTIDISVLPEAEQDLIKALFDKCCERVNQKVAEVKPRIWKPECGERYHYIDGSGSIYSTIWFNTRIDNGRWNLGNVFKTQKKQNLQERNRKLRLSFRGSLMNTMILIKKNGMEKMFIVELDIV